MRFGWFRRSLICGLLLPIAPAVAGPPDWLAASLAEPVVPRNPNVAVIDLLESGEVTYVTPDQTENQLRGAMRVVTAAGLNLAHAAMTYDADTEHILSARAWVVSADGKKVKSYGRGDFLNTVAQYNNYFWDAWRVISFDGSDKVETGGTVAWEIRFEAPAGVLSSSWSFLDQHDLASGRFKVIPSPGSVLQWHSTSSRISPPVSGEEPGSLLWEVSNLSPFATGRPSGFLPNSLEISVRCVPANQAGQPAITWNDEAKLIDGIVGPKIESSDVVKAQAAALTAGKAKRWERIRALAEFTQRDIVYLSITLDKDYLAGYRPHPAPEVLRNRFGDCKDKATLLVSLLRAIGEEGYVVLLNAGNPMAVSADWPSLDFNHAIVAIPADDSVPAGWPVADGGTLGKLVIFDPTDPTTPLGVLSGLDQGGLGLIVEPGQKMPVRLPVADPAFSRAERTIDGQIGAQGDLKATVVEDLHGLQAARIYGFRFALGAEHFEKALESSVHEVTPLAENLHWTDNWDAPATTYRLNFSFTSERYARPMGDDMMIVAPRILPETTQELPWRTAAEGVVLMTGLAISQEVRLAMPEGYTVEELPDGWTQQQPSASGTLSYEVEGREIVYRCRVSQRGGIYAKPEYNVLRLFLQELAQAARRPVILKRTQAATQ